MQCAEIAEHLAEDMAEEGLQVCAGFRVLGCAAMYTLSLVSVWLRASPGMDSMWLCAGTEAPSSPPSQGRTVTVKLKSATTFEVSARAAVPCTSRLCS